VEEPDVPTRPIWTSWLLLGGAALALPSGRAMTDDPLPLEKRTYKDARGRTLPYRYLRPESIGDPRMRFPLVLFLHGAGERGTDNEKQLIHGVPEFVKPENRRKYPCYLIAPQCPEGRRWVEVDWGAPRHDMPAEPSEPLRMALELVEAEAKEWLGVDPKRVYITGLSMGGYGVWDAACRRPELFAAAVPVCGGGDEKQAARLTKLPIWAFHGAKDTAVPPERSRNMIAAVRKAGGSPRYTEYPDVGHDSWRPAYRDPALFAWLFAQKRD
jgi:predicted peptidase